MKKNDQWMYGEFVRNQWGFEERTFTTIVYDNKIPAYDIYNERLEADEAFHIHPDGLKFRSEDIENFQLENEHLFKNKTDIREQIMDAKASQELGRLRREKEKWDSAIDVAVKIGLFCHEQNKKLKRKEVWDHVIHIDKNLPDTTIEKIWRAIPKQYRSQGGRPKNS